MNVTGVSPQLRETLAVFDGPGRDAPLTTSEVADELPVSRRSAYERLMRLADSGLLETKKVGAKARIWWRDTGEESDLQQRVRQQEVVAELGQHALAERDIESLLQRACGEVAETLGTDYCKVLELADDGEELLLRSGVGWRDGIVGTTTVSATDDDSQAAHTLATDEPVVVEDLRTEARFSGPDLLTDHGVRSGISVIIGTTEKPWGILGTHDRACKSFAVDDVNFVQSVANILASAIGRRADEEVLVSQRKQLAAVVSLQDVVREVTDAVIDQSTRGEIESVVCERLAGTDSYEFAWIGDVDHRSQTVQVRAEAGVENYLDDISISVDPDDERSEGPTGRAFLTGETQTCQQIRMDPRYEPWLDHAGAHGYQSSAAIPVVHEGTVYGVLNVYADRPNGILERERTVLTQLGEIVGHAIAAVERKRALMSDTVTELGFHVGDIGEMLDIDDVTGTVHIDEAIPVSDGEYLVYGTVTRDGADLLETVIDRLEHWDGVETHDVDGEDVTSFEARLIDPPVLTALANAGGGVVEAGIDDGSYHMTLQLPVGGDVRSVIETVQSVYPSAKMLTRRQTAREELQSASPTAEIAEGLTDRQSAVVRAAYHAGFFEWPRTVSGEDVARSLDIAPPTFHQHLRKAEKHIFDELVPALL
ncbi:GAF domain-containing protein [Haloarcula onubensis]|uniref:GAF domain-containing protein n=1 Tax=Haloarcula onubensis TaxID=2950539 RepID=A0ABU2FWK2_9EURY|nr:GAF domain-containing protein [Halomicroarcula sp. S3CR25-11]MDS0284617.1 GAF domain-containing protein [Halomicroarcula sp. S3CR25-11]